MQRLGKYSQGINAAEKDFRSVCEYVLGSFWVQLNVSYVIFAFEALKHGKFKTLKEPAATIYMRQIQSNQQLKRPAVVNASQISVTLNYSIC